MVNIDEMQFGFAPGRGTTDAIFIVCQLQEKYIAAKKLLYFAFVDIEKAFDRVARKVLWWALRSSGVEEWAVRVIWGMYSNVRSHVQVNDGYSEEFGVHQGCVLSPLLLILVLEALLYEFHIGVPWKLLIADDLVLIADTQEECISKLKAWKAGMESKGLCVNMKKFLVPGDDHDGFQKSGKYPCAVCCSGVGRTHSVCMLWIHKTCSGISKQLAEGPN